MVEDQLRTMKIALEDRLAVKIPLEHPLTRWMVEHAAMLLTHYHVSPEDGKTGYERLHGRHRARMPEFGETVFWYVPKKNRHKMDPRRRAGAFLCRA